MTPTGERFLDFPRPLPVGVTFMGSIGEELAGASQVPAPLPSEIESVYGAPNTLGVVIFSLGTVSNTSNMPPGMVDKFVEAFARLPQYNFLVKLEMSLPAHLRHATNVHVGGSNAH